MHSQSCAVPSDEDQGSTSSPVGSDDPNTAILLQLEGPTLSNKDAIAYLKEDYIRIVEAEEDCAELIKAQGSNKYKLDEEQWKTLLSRPRTLLDKHYRIFLVFQAPAIGKGGRDMYAKYNMPNRLWEKGIIPFLGMLEQRLPHSQGPMLEFLCEAFDHVSMLYESDADHKHLWKERLGSLASYYKRYYKVVEETNIEQIIHWEEMEKFWSS